MTSACLFLLLWIGCWRSFVTANGPCVPEVRGEPFVQYVEKKNCDVDKKLLKLFNPVSFNESVTNNRTLNFMCTGFIDALNLTTDSTLESLCVYGLLSDIRDTDFCSNDRMMTVLEAVVENAVFDKISIIVANFTRNHCHVICDSSNELCWAFGITAKLVLKQSVTSTTPPTNATEPTTVLTTEPTAVPSTEVPIPDFFNDKTSHTSDVHNDNGDTSDTPVDETVPNKVSPVSGSIGDVQKPHEIGDTGEGTARTDAKQEILISPSNDGSQNLQNNVTINNDTTVNPTTASSTTVIANATVTAKPTTATSANTSESSSAQNVTTSEDYINEEMLQDSFLQPEGEDNAQDYGAEDTNKTGQDDQRDHDSIIHVVNLIDDDDDDGYSYFHFAAILLFILFLGVAGYLASHNRKKV